MVSPRSSCASGRRCLLPADQNCEGDGEEDSIDGDERANAHTYMARQRYPLVLEMKQVTIIYETQNIRLCLIKPNQKVVTSLTSKYYSRI